MAFLECFFLLVACALTMRDLSRRGVKLKHKENVKRTAAQSLLVGFIYGIFLLFFGIAIWVPTSRATFWSFMLVNFALTGIMSVLLRIFLTFLFRYAEWRFRSSSRSRRTRTLDDLSSNMPTDLQDELL